MLVIRNATVHTGESLEVLDTTDIRVEDGKIAELGVNLDVPGDFEVIDAGGRHVTPGLIDCHAHLGIWETEAGSEGRDHNETTDPNQPQLRALDAVHWADNAFRHALEAGITTVITGPGDANVIAGQSIAVKTVPGRVPDGRVIKEQVAMRLNLGDVPRGTYKKDGPKFPSTRMGIAALVRDQLRKAARYAEKEPDEQSFDFKLSELGRLLSGELKATFVCRRTDDTATAVRLTNEFGLDSILVDTVEGHLIPDFIAKSGLPAVVCPQLSGKMSLELRHASHQTASVLHQHGVPVGIASNSPRPPAQYLQLLASLCVKEGLPSEEALRAITSAPARFFGLEDRVGSLAPGLDADIVMWSSSPLDWWSQPELIVVNGTVYQPGS